MSKDIERLIKIQGAINKNVFHLCIDTDLEEKYRWVLFLYFPQNEKYFDDHNVPILTSETDSIDYLLDYLKKHNGLKSWKTGW